MSRVKLDNRTFYSTMLSLAVPVALQNLLATCANIVDTAMVTSLGNAEVTAVGVGGRWLFLLNVFIWGIGTGAGAQISQYWGAGQKDNMRRTQCTALLMCLGFGLIFALATFAFPDQMIGLFNKEAEVVYFGARYLRIIGVGALFTVLTSVCSTAFRSTENVKVPMIIAAIGVGINTLLNYILIFGKFGAPKLGVDGAAIATTVSLIFQGIAFIALGLKRRHFSITALAEIGKVPLGFIKKFLSVAMPAGFNELMWGTGTLICTAVFARQGSDNYAAYTIFNSIETLAFVFFQGLAAASSVMIGKTVGLGLLDRAYAMAKRVLIITPIMGVVTGLLLIAVRDPILMLFDVETEATRQLVRSLLLCYGLWFGVRMINYSSVCGIFRAGGDSRFGMIMDLVGLYGFAIPGVFAAAYLFKWPFLAIVVTMLVLDDTVKIPLALLRFCSRKWIIQLTKKEDEELCLKDS